MILWGLLFLVPLGFAEIDDHVPEPLRAGADIGLLGALALALELAGAKLEHPPMRYPALATILLLVPLAALWEGDLRAHLLSHAGWFGWPVYLLAGWLSLRRFVPETPAVFRNLHPVAVVGLAFAVGLEAYRAVLDLGALSRDWAFAAAGMPSAALLTAIVGASPRPLWPFSEERERYMGAGALALCGCLGLWMIAFDLDARGASAPLEYLPILNPVDLAQLLAFAAILGWLRAYRRAGYHALPSDLIAALPTTLAGFAFFWFNAMLARSVHQLAGVPFDATALWHSVPLQVALSISWSVIALGMTVLASRYRARAIWIAGAVLLGVVVVKLFTIDLARLSTLARIGTFLVVGVLLLAIGYLAPVPPLTKPSAPGAPEPAAERTPPEQGEAKKVSP